MHAAQVTTWGQPPQYLEIAVPEATPNTFRIKVLAAGLHHVVRSRAAGRHYSSKKLPHIPGVDGVGTIISSDGSTGQRVYFTTFATGGSFADIVTVPVHAATPLPEDVDTVQAAAMVNPGTSSWMALSARTGGVGNLPKGFTVLILGATSASGTAAIQVARALGAGKVIGIARNEAKLESLGLDEAIVLKDPVADTEFEKVGDVDVVLDYVYGSPAEESLKRLKTARPVQYVHIGGLDGSDIRLPGSVLRSKNLTIRGAGPGSWSFQEMGRELPKLLGVMGAWKKADVRVVRLADVGSVWGEAVAERTVFVP